MELLDPLDALMLTGELISSPMHVAALMILRPPPGLDADEAANYVTRIYEETLSYHAEVDPRLRRVPHSGIDTGFMWAWRDVADGGLDIRHHFQRRTLPSPSADDAGQATGDKALWRLVSELHALRMDRSEPLWMAYLIDGLPDGRFAFYIKVHHIVVDGVAGLQMITGSLSTDPDQRGMAPFYAAKAPAQQSNAAPGSAFPGPLSALRGIAKTAAAGVGLTAKVMRTQISTAVASLLDKSVIAPFSAPQTRFNTKLGTQRAVAGTTLERRRIHAVQQAAGVTGNDVVMAVISGALRSWLAQRDELPDRSLVAICPVTVRSRDTATADSHGNQFGLGLCTLGTDLDDPAERLHLVSTAMESVKNRVAEQGPGVMLVVLGPAIGPTILLPLLPFATGVPPSFNIPISGVPGPREPRYFNGALVEEIYPVSTVYDGMALNVTVCSYADQISVGYVADRDVVPDVETLIPLTAQALSELETAVGV